MLASEAYEQTDARDRRYLDAGYRVFQVWGHEFAECERAVAPRDVRAVCREVFNLFYTSRPATARNHSG